MLVAGKRLTRWYQIPEFALPVILALFAGFSTPSAAAKIAHFVQEPTHLTPTAGIGNSQAYSVPPDKLGKAVALGYIRPTIHFAAEIWELTFLWLLLATGTAKRFSDWCTTISRHRWLQGTLFSAMLVTALFLITELPLSAIGHAFSLHYGISVEAWLPWLLDELKTLALALALETPALLLLFGLTQWTWSQRRYWLWYWVAVIPVVLLGAFLLPAIIEPIFYTYEPLAKSHPALVTQLERVVARTGTSIPPERMFLMKASDKTNGLNAYVSGMGSTKRIVVWDTTADRMPTDQIVFTFAHESGHYVLNHIPKGLAAGIVGLFVLFGASAWLAESFVQRSGGRWHVNTVASLPGMVVILLAFSLLQAITEPIGNIGSRYIEHQADVYGQEAIHGIVADPQKTAVASFNTLGRAYLDDPNPNPFIVFWTYSHPSSQERATFAEHYDPWAPGQQPQFFAK
jgi:Zn-dependent protease with chaperone function